jgi:drug/metabolite transporter (DMT)-like permease
MQGFFTFGLSYVCTYNAEQYVVSALVAVLFALMVFWTPLLSRLVFGTPIPRKTWTAGVGAIAGVVLLFWHSIAALHDLHRASRATCCSAWGWASAPRSPARPAASSSARCANNRPT